MKTIIILQPILGTSETKLFPNDLKIMSAPDVKDELEMLEKISNNLYQVQYISVMKTVKMCHCVWL